MAELSRSLAVLVDYENMARPGAKGRGDFDINLVLSRLTDKGRVLVKRAYADWSRYRDARHDLQNAGLELIEMPSAREGAKNRADIKMAVDAMELAFSREHLDTFVIVSGDSDFTPLVGKVRELNKRVIGVGNRESASELLIANCDEFIYYDLLAASRRGGASGRTLDPNELLRQTLLALQREGTEWPLASVVKDSMRRRNPAFDETEANFSTFSKFLEDARDRSLIRLESDSRSGTYRVELADSAAVASGSLPSAEKDSAGDGESESGGRGQRRRRRGRRRSEPSEAPESTEARADVFEFVVSGTETQESELPEIPLDRAITYEDVVMLGPELLAPDEAESDTELLEASDRTDEEETPARRRRRRRSTAKSDEADDTTSTEATAEESVEAAETAEDAPAAGSRRRRRGSRSARSEASDSESTEAESTDAEATEAAPEVSAEPVTDEEPAPPSRSRRRRSTRTAEPVAEETPAEEPPADEPAPAADEATPAATGDEADEDAAPAGGRRRVRRGSRSIPTAEAEAAETADATEEAPAEEKPKRRRTTRKTAEPAADAETADATEEAPAEEKPKRRRTTRKKAEPAADAETADATEEAPAEEKPKRRRTTRKKAEPAADAETTDATE